MSISAGGIEIDSLFKEVITGNANSRVAKLIDSLHNSDWVKVGLSFDTKDICPFCQRPYLDDDIIAELRSYFNEDYEKAVADIESKGKLNNQLCCHITQCSTKAVKTQITVKFRTSHAILILTE